MRAAVIGMVAVLIFMLFYYHAAGINADLGLVLNLVILLGFLGYSGATLTLPGIAGVILTVGMGVDSNVLIFDDGVRVAHEVDEQLHRGEITLRQAWDRQAALLPWDRVPEMTGFVVREIPLRVGARELIDLLQKHSVPVVVLSGGLDFYIRAILDREGLEYPFLSDTSSKGPHGQLKVEHPHGHAPCVANVVFAKRKPLECPYRLLIVRSS